MSFIENGRWLWTRKLGINSYSIYTSHNIFVKGLSRRFFLFFSNLHLAFKNYVFQFTLWDRKYTERKEIFVISTTKYVNRTISSQIWLFLYSIHIIWTVHDEYTTSQYTLYNNRQIHSQEWKLFQLLISNDLKQMLTHDAHFSSMKDYLSDLWCINALWKNTDKLQRIN